MSEPEQGASKQPNQDGGLPSSSSDQGNFVKGPTKTNPYIDDISLFMAWQNWCLMEHNRFLSNFCVMQFSQQQMLMQQQQQQMAFNANAQTLQPERHSLSQNGGAEIAGVEVKFASFKRRLAAELIDFFFLLFVKLFVITYIFGESYANHFQYILVVDENTTFEDLQSTLIQALLFRVVAIAYEGYCLSGSLPLSNGATLGKRIMKLEVIRCDIAEDVDAMEGRIRVLPAGNLGVFRSIIRAILKNAIISLFFPMLLPFQMIANNNRLIYDIAIGTVVIEKE